MDVDAVNITSLPPEIIEIILETNILTFVDVCNFGSTCSNYWEFVNGKCNLLWRKKFHQMWPRLLEENRLYYTQFANFNWIDEFRIRWTVGQQTRKLLDLMPLKHINHDELSYTDFKPFEEVLDSTNHILRLQFMIDELMLCCHNGNKYTNMTMKYYGMKALRHLRQMAMMTKWEEFKNSVPEEQLLEKGAVIAAQWIEPYVNITYHSIAVQLEYIADKVRERIQQDYGSKHVALEVAEDLRSHWRTHILSDNHYSPHESRQVLTAISKVLFQDMGFNGNNDAFHSYKNSCIDKVLALRGGSPLLISSIYDSVARRLGIKCEPLIFSGHFLLRWKDSYSTNVPSEYFYIDVYYGNTFLDKNLCPRFSDISSRCPMSRHSHRAASAVEVVEKLVSGMELACRQCAQHNGERIGRMRSALELLHLVAPANLNCILQLTRFYMQYFLDASRLLAALDTITLEVRDLGQASYIRQALKEYSIAYQSVHTGQGADEIEVKTRPEDLKYTVGMVMHHRIHNYTCVVTGWDIKCQATHVWKKQMNVQSLARMDRQPFYNVLVNDGSQRYAAEDNLEIETGDCWVTHVDVGKYFNTFCQTHYLANPILSLAYPEDLEVLRLHMGIH